MLTIVKDSEFAYLQIVNYFQIEIISGKLKLGEKMPTVRALAKQLKVGISTVAKAYKILKGEKYIIYKISKGSFVGTPEPREFW